MRKAALVGAIALLIASPALAEDNIFYAEWTGGYEFGTDVELAGVDVATDGGYHYGAALGVDLPDGLTFEGEVAYSNRSLDGAPVTVESATIMANAYVDFDINENFEAYVGGGIGAVGVRIDLLGISDTDAVLGYQGIVGATLRASDRVKLVGEYRYVAGTDLFIGGANVTYDSHRLGAGIRFGF